MGKKLSKPAWSYMKLSNSTPWLNHELTVINFLEREVQFH